VDEKVKKSAFSFLCDGYLIFVTIQNFKTIQKPEARSQKPEARSQKPEARSQKPEARISQASRPQSQGAFVYCSNYREV
jgi:hypothetical protein